MAYQLSDDLEALERWSVVVLEDSHNPAERDNANNFLALIRRIREAEDRCNRLHEILQTNQKHALNRIQALEAECNRKDGIAVEGLRLTENPATHKAGSSQ